MKLLFRVWLSTIIPFSLISATINPEAAFAQSAKSLPDSSNARKTKNRAKLKNLKRRYRFVGNTYSKKFHKPQCEFTRKMNVKHVILIESKKIAESKSYKECNWCMPKWTKSVSSKIVETNPGK